MENIVGKKVYITSTCGGFINRDYFLSEGYSFEGIVNKIVASENPFEIVFNNGKSTINLKREHFIVVNENNSIESIIDNIKFVLLTRDNELYVLNTDLNEANLFENIDSERIKYKKYLFSNQSEAEIFLDKFYLRKLLKIESYYVKDSNNFNKISVVNKCGVV